MKWSFASVGLIVLGLIGVAVIILFQQVTTNNENDYYLLKEVTEAAMIDSIDIPYYRETGNLKIVTEKFVENFTRRFAESTIFVTSEYNINFYDIIETPPKVSIIVNTGLGEYKINGNSDEYGIANKLDAILEYTGKNTNVSINDPDYGKPYDSKEFTNEYYAIISSGDSGILSIKEPSNLLQPNIKNIKIDSTEYIGVVTKQEEFNLALLKNGLSYNNVTNYGYLMNVSDFSTNASNINIDYHNCSDGKFGYDCNDINKYFVIIDGNINNKVVLKYKVTWSYEEYEY